jgi:prepilin-type N-terminal cleavage/methylation domain-containing protein
MGNGFKKRSGGFSLVEILVVVAVAGVLVSLAVPTLNKVKERSLEHQREKISNAIEFAKQQYVNSSPTRAHDGEDTVLYENIAIYVLVDGKNPKTILEVSDKDYNGTGLNIIDWGTYPDKEGNSTKVTWGLGPALNQ